MTHPLADTPLQPGDIVGGRYRVIQAIGEGPLDQLYEAQDVDLHERAIIRVQHRSMAADARQVRLFEDQARCLGKTVSGHSFRLLELSQDAGWGHFAAISNSENRPLTELLALMDGVDGYEGPSASDQGPVLEETPAPDNGYRFPSRQSQVELETLDPPDSLSARDQTEPRFARPHRPQRLDTLELDAPKISRATGPRPTIRLRGSADWRRLLRRAVMAALLLSGLGAGAALYLDRQGREESSQDPDDEVDKSMAVTAPHREVNIVFRVTPTNARLRIQGQVAPGHSILVPESTAPIVARFEASGYQSRNIKIVPDRNRTVNVALNRSP